LDQSWVVPLACLTHRNYEDEYDKSKEEAEPREYLKFLYRTPSKGIKGRVTVVGGASMQREQHQVSVEEVDPVVG